MGIAAALVLSLVMVPAPVASEYVALGDSYAAGVGSGSSGECGRSASAHPSLWNAEHSPAAFRFVACTGATTQDVLDGQVASLSSTTTLVTLTVGGNDIGFTEVMTTCTLSSDEGCEAAVAQAGEVIRTELPGRLERLLAEVRARAPIAQVVLLGYPRLFESGDCVSGTSAAKRAAVNSGADSLAATTAAAAQAAGVAFVDVREAFTGHGICGADPWLHSITLPVRDSYHPNRNGQTGYLRALEAELR
ncbi:SGNH/GDSL hydrolase family protein [Umezawaea endophytica]|uniref:SGNH/GDSL hydrolase family protein n=1 Tax=Umezawaea endophytica TaxID=1654476 RepID=A0A9X2VUB9_9PSEU|nr:SGNH/GDSL hydrolase family protein [Umezawaea endophytica]MCS7482801.1 SGNH/GDSL hydrolase family protein [Umezawaea endophytica]